MVVAAPGVGQLGDALAPPATVGSSLNQRVLLMYLTPSSDLMVVAAPGVGQLGDALAPRYRGVLSKSESPSLDVLDQDGSLAAPITWPGSPPFPQHPNLWESIWPEMV
jgi:hypothetical protein